MTRRAKTLRATMFEAARTVEIEPLVYGDNCQDFAVYVDGVKIGTVSSFRTQSERKISGSRLVTRGAYFTAWAQRSTRENDRYDYYMQHRSMSAAIRRLIDNTKEIGS